MKQTLTKATNEATEALKELKKELGQLRQGDSFEGARAAGAVEKAGKALALARKHLGRAIEEERSLFGEK